MSAEKGGDGRVTDADESRTDGESGRTADADDAPATDTDAEADGRQVVEVDGREYELPEDVPEWDDEYLDRVGANLMFNFDLERDFRVDGETFDLYGELRMDSHKQFLTSALSYGHQKERHHLFARRIAGSVTVRDLERLADLGHDVADDWIDANEEHYGTEFTFVVVAPDIPDEVRSFVAGFQDRNLIKYGYYGHYELNLAVVAPDVEDVVASRNADPARAFVLWDEDPLDRPGLLGRLLRRLKR
ncbi:hypothetical protein SAMN04487949_0074 [Halogranum gelatinilyticum]|uniref:DUF8052 domain-containing protein n=1 Tax=Halogranum gelatinilyticum TaxID=660521 RepID=A0A1G9NRF9_9EURY|nr:hypothetical protein [Halogranum gelatinilyticum]SDL88969.1 hypothetical protein SAMN04487949_0074 [Halogranum gelatinilyticum]